MTVLEARDCVAAAVNTETVDCRLLERLVSEHAKCVAPKCPYYTAPSRSVSSVRLST